jgi:hypothetical protein
MCTPPKRALVVKATPLERATPPLLGCSAAGVGPPWPTTDSGARVLPRLPSGEYPVDRIRMSSGNIGQYPAPCQKRGGCHTTAARLLQRQLLWCRDSTVGVRVAAQLGTLTLLAVRGDRRTVGERGRPKRLIIFRDGLLPEYEAAHLEPDRLSERRPTGPRPSGGTAGSAFPCGRRRDARCRGTTDTPASAATGDRAESRCCRRRT